MIWVNHVLALNGHVNVCFCVLFILSTHQLIRMGRVLNTNIHMCPMRQQRPCHTPCRVLHRDICERHKCIRACRWHVVQCPMRHTPTRLTGKRTHGAFLVHHQIRRGLTVSIPLIPNELKRGKTVLPFVCLRVQSRDTHRIRIIPMQFVCHMIDKWRVSICIHFFVSLYPPIFRLRVYGQSPTSL